MLVVRRALPAPSPPPAEGPERPHEDAAVATGPRRWSEHAFGRAVDVNPVENPYLQGGRGLPPSGRAYADRSRIRPGMAVAGGALVRAFAASGWAWGGGWSSSRDYQHFSASGR